MQLLWKANEQWHCST